MLNFEIRYTKALVILCILAIIFIGLSFVLPIEYSYENHFLENLEVVILFLGIVICIGRIRDFILYLIVYGVVCTGFLTTFILKLAPLLTLLPAAIF